MLVTLLAIFGKSMSDTQILEIEEAHGNTDEMGNTRFASEFNLKENISSFQVVLA